MMFQVVARRMSIGQNYWHDRPYPPTTDFQEAKRQYTQVATGFPRPLRLLILMGDGGAEIQEQFELFTHDKPCRTIDPNEVGERIALEMAPLRESYPPPRWTPLLANYALPTETFRRLVRLMLDVAEGKKGGPNDGADPPPSVVPVIEGEGAE